MWLRPLESAKFKFKFEFSQSEGSGSNTLFSLLASYRPISNLSFLSKVVVKVVDGSLSNTSRDTACSPFASQRTARFIRRRELLLAYTMTCAAWLTKVTLVLWYCSICQLPSIPLTILSSWTYSDDGLESTAVLRGLLSSVFAPHLINTSTRGVTGLGLGLGIWTVLVLGL